MFINYAHRGASEYFPENTFSAFYAGLTMGANGIETDVQRTKDGILVLFHDDTIDRVTDGTGPISSYTYQELLSMPIYNKKRDRKDRIVSLEDFLKYFSFRDLTFAIELKQPGTERETIDMLDRYGMRAKTVLTSFQYNSICIAKEYCPAYPVGLLYGKSEPDPVGKLREIGGEQICPEAGILTKEDTQRYHAMGFNVRAWGIYTPEIMENALAMGVDGMTVNFPDLLSEKLKGR